MAESARTIPYPVFAIIAGPFISKLATHQELGTVGRALVVGLGVLVLASIVALLLGRTRRNGILVIMAGVGAAVGSLLADSFA